MAEKYLDKAGVQKLWAKTKDLVSQKVNAIDVYKKSEIDAKLNGKANSVHSHSVSDITDLKKGQANGVASLGSDGRVPSSQLPSYVDDVLEFTNKATFPQTGEDGKIYVAEDTNKTYRWSGSAYVEISASLALGETSSTAYAGDKGKKNADDIAQLQTDLEGKADVNHLHENYWEKQDTVNGSGIFYKYKFSFKKYASPLTISGQYGMDDEGIIILGGHGEKTVQFVANAPANWGGYTKLSVNPPQYSNVALQVSKSSGSQGVEKKYDVLDTSMVLTEEDLNSILV